MPYYEMSLENGREYIYENNFDVAEAAMGLWLIVFLDVDWLGYQTLAEPLWEEGDTIPPESGDQDYIEQWQIGYARKVAEWYWHLKSELSPQHPLLNLLVEQQFHNHLLVALQPDPMYDLSPEMQRKLQSACLEYMELIDKPSESDSQCWVHPDYLRAWLRFVAQILHQLHDCQQKLTPLLDRVMYGKDENHDSNLMRQTIDECIGVSSDFDYFLKSLIRRGYVLDCAPNRKYPTIRAIGSKKPVRLYHLGEGYSVPEIQKRIHQLALEIRYSREREDESVEPGNSSYSVSQ